MARDAVGIVEEIKQIIYEGERKGRQIDRIFGTFFVGLGLIVVLSMAYHAGKVRCLSDIKTCAADVATMKDVW